MPSAVGWFGSQEKSKLSSELVRLQQQLLYGGQLSYTVCPKTGSSELLKYSELHKQITFVLVIKVVSLLFPEVYNERAQKLLFWQCQKLLDYYNYFFRVNE